MPLDSFIAAAAAFCTTASYVPQLKKVGQTRETDDLSLKMLLMLAAGLALWIVYGLIRTDLVIIAANAVSLMLLACIIYFKLRERKAPHDGGDKRRATSPALRSCRLSSLTDPPSRGLLGKAGMRRRGRDRMGLPRV